MTKSEAREAVADIIAALKPRPAGPQFGELVESAYFGFYCRKWKSSTAKNNKQRVRTHLLAVFKERELSSFRRDELQDFLDRKASTHSFSVVDHLRWDLKAIFDMAIAEGMLTLNPAALLYTPKEAARPINPVLTAQQVGQLLSALAPRERLIAKLAILAGMRPGEIFGLTWGRITEASADERQRVYRGKLDTPKTKKSVREAALTDGLLAELAEHRAVRPNTSDEAFVFPSESGTPLSKDNVWRRNMQPGLTKVGLGWANFQVMRRTHATLMRQLKADPKAVADQLGHSVDVSLNVYANTPVHVRQPLVNALETLIQ
jgi:integrase